MAVLLETSRGDIVIDLFVDECPVACKNFLKLCKIKYYNNCIFHNVQRNFIAQTGDPTGTGKGGTSIYGLMYGDQARFFDDELRPKLKHKVKGMVGMASPLPNANASQFYITTGEDIHSLDGKHTIFGQVGEGLDILDSINEAFVDEAGRPLQNIRIRHTIILEDPFDDPEPLESLIPAESPQPQFEQGDRLEDDWRPHEDTRTAEEIEEETRRAEAQNKAVVLEMIGDLPEADAKPPSNVLFICKLNPVTTEEDLEIIFSRFGRVTDCDIIRDYKTGDSLCYGFIGFETEPQCEEAYFKMNNVLIDDRRIKVDFSQSVSHLWKQFKKGGRKGGDASLLKPGDTAERRNDSKFELKRNPYGMGGGGRGGGRGGGPRHQMLIDDSDLQDEPAPAARAAPPVDRDNGRGRYSRGDGRRGGEREPDRPAGRYDEHPSSGRDRSRHERDEQRDRREPRDRDRDRRQDDAGDKAGSRNGDHRGSSHRSERHDRDRDDRREYGRDRETDGQSNKESHRSDRDRDRGDRDRGRDRDRDRGDRDRERSHREADRGGERRRERSRERERERSREGDRRR